MTKTCKRRDRSRDLNIKKETSEDTNFDITSTSNESSSNLNSETLFPNKSVEDEDKKECTICLGDSDDKAILPCKHLFCHECILQWSKRENSCPLCKVRFSSIERFGVNDGTLKPKKKRKINIKPKSQSDDFTRSMQLHLNPMMFTETIRLFGHFFSGIRFFDDSFSWEESNDFLNDDDLIPFFHLNSPTLRRNSQSTVIDLTREEDDAPRLFPVDQELVQGRSSSSSSSSSAVLYDTSPVQSNSSSSQSSLSVQNVIEIDLSPANEEPSVSSHQSRKRRRPLDENDE